MRRSGKVLLLLLLLFLISRWDESTLWSPGALVRHSKDLYKAEGIATAAEPGNAMHGRFYVSLSFKTFNSTFNLSLTINHYYFIFVFVFTYKGFI